MEMSIFQCHIKTCLCTRALDGDSEIVLTSLMMALVLRYGRSTWAECSKLEGLDIVLESSLANVSRAPCEEGMGAGVREANLIHFSCNECAHAHFMRWRVEQPERTKKGRRCGALAIIGLDSAAPVNTTHQHSHAWINQFVQTPSLRARIFIAGAMLHLSPPYVIDAASVASRFPCPAMLASLRQVRVKDGRGLICANL